MMAAHRTLWPSVQTELKVIPNPADSIAASRITLYVAEGVFSLCFPLSPETARALAADLVAGADTLQSPDPILSAQRNEP